MSLNIPNSPLILFSFYVLNVYNLKFSFFQLCFEILSGLSERIVTDSVYFTFFKSNLFGILSKVNICYASCLITAIYENLLKEKLILSFGALQIGQQLRDISLINLDL